MYRPISLAFAAFVLAVLTSCGGSPPSDVVNAEITKAVYAANLAMFNANKDNAEVVNIKLGKWEKEKLGELGTLYETTWKANLRFKEPVACIIAEVDGKNIVKVVADKGEELSFEGRCGGGKADGKWDMGANAMDKSNDFMGPGVWKSIADRAPGLTMGYPVVSNGMQSTPKFRRQNFQPLSELKPYILEGSDEYKKFEAEAAERAQKAQEAAAERARLQREKYEAEQAQRRAEAEERQRKYQEEQARLQAEAQERQRLAQEEYKRQQEEAAEKARIAREEALAKAAAEKHARLLNVLKPLQSATGAVIAAEAGPTLGTILLDATIDQEKLSVSGNAIDLREMPFKEFTYTGSVDDRGVFTFKSSLGGDPTLYTASGDKLATRGYTISALADADRASMNSLITLGKRLGSAAPVSLSAEVIDAEAAKIREPQLRLTGLNGSVFYRNRLDARVSPLFSADMASNRAYAWRGGEIVAVRLNEPAKGTGIFIRGTTAPSTELVVTINGIHKVTIPSIPKLGDAIIALPADLEILDIRFEATGAVSARTIGLMK